MLPQDCEFVELRRAVDPHDMCRRLDLESLAKVSSACQLGGVRSHSFKTLTVEFGK